MIKLTIGIFGIPTQPLQGRGEQLHRIFLEVLVAISVQEKSSHLREVADEALPHCVGGLISAEGKEVEDISYLDHTSTSLIRSTAKSSHIMKINRYGILFIKV